jgi:hypothetical protein
MQSDSSSIIAETFCAEIDSLLRTNEDNIIAVLLHYKRSGKEVYEFVKEPDFWTRWMHPHIFVGNYPFGEDTQVVISVGKEKHDLYYRMIKGPKDKNT